MSREKNSIEYRVSSEERKRKEIQDEIASVASLPRNDRIDRRDACPTICEERVNLLSA